MVLLQQNSHTKPTRSRQMSPRNLFCLGFLIPTRLHRHLPPDRQVLQHVCRLARR